MQLIAVYAVLLRRVVGIPVSQMVGDLAPAVLGSLALLAVCFPLAHLLREVDAPPIVIVAAVGIDRAGDPLPGGPPLLPAVWHDLAALASRVLPSAMTRRGAARAEAEAISVPQ